MNRTFVFWAIVAAMPVAGAPRTELIAPKSWVVFEARDAAREPDGNSVVFEAPRGLIVVDSGRHAAHRQALLDLAGQLNRPIAAIINSHWHLDHVSGNPGLRAAYPRLTVYASNAIEGALRGFLADSLKNSPRYLADEQLPATLRQDVAADRLTILEGAALKPDVVVSRSATRTIAGKRLALRLADHAATAGDVWVFDSRSGVAALGDLVTLPAPFFETGCPQGWSDALATVERTPLRTAIPGHGPKMSSTDLHIYRGAFDALMACAHGSDDPKECGSAWANRVEELLHSGQYQGADAANMAAYYVALLRKTDFQRHYCESD